MKIAISSTGPDLESEVDPRFGRCQYFMIVDLNDMSFEAVPNGNLAQGSGVGIQSAKVVADKGAEAVLTGNVGPNAHQVLAAAGLKVVTGVSGPVREAAQQYKNGQLRTAEQANVVDHFGLQAGPNKAGIPAPGQESGAGFGMGRGMGGGRGMGRGRCMGGGRGMGGGMGRGVYGQPPIAPPAELSRKEELVCLKEDAQALEEQMKDTQRRIKEIEKEK